MLAFVYKRRTALDISLRLLDLAIGDDNHESVLDALGAGIRAAIERIESVREEVVDYETDIIENILGVAYVACQPKITAVSQAVKNFPDQGLNVRNLLALGPRFDKGYSKVEVLWELANYFKHRDQWTRKTWTNPDKHSKRTVTVLKAVGLAWGSSAGNLRTGAVALGNASYTDVAVFHRLIRDWSTAVREQVRANLHTKNRHPPVRPKGRVRRNHPP